MVDQIISEAPHRESVNSTSPYLENNQCPGSALPCDRLMPNGDVPLDGVALTIMGCIFNRVTGMGRTFSGF